VIIQASVVLSVAFVVIKPDTLVSDNIMK